MGKSSTWLGVGLLLGIAVTYTWATWQFYTLNDRGGNDFFVHYSMWRASWRYGLSPYSDEAVYYTQLDIYGRPALPTEDQNILVYPYYSVVLYGPFVALDFPLARAIFMTLLQAALLLGVILSVKLAQWKPPAWLLVLLLTWGLLNYHEARAVLLGQFALLGFGLMAACLYLLQQQRDLAAGLAFTLLTIKPTLIFLIAPFLVLWALARRRWRFLLAFFGGTALLSAASLLAQPTWISEWLQRVVGYQSYTGGQGLVWLFTHLAVPWLGQPGELLIDALLVGGMLWAWWRAARPGADAGREFHWAFAVTLVVSNFIVPRSATPNYALLLIPTIWIFAALDRWAGRLGQALTVALMALMLVGHWWLHLSTVVGNQEQAILFVPWPLLMALIVVPGRRWLLADARQAGMQMA